MVVVVRCVYCEVMLLRVLTSMKWCRVLEGQWPLVGLRGVERVEVLMERVISEVFVFLHRTVMMSSEEVHTSRNLPRFRPCLDMNKLISSGRFRLSS
jgi:hypothetical protein